MKAVQPVLTSIGIPYLQTRWQNLTARQGEGGKRKGLEVVLCKSCSQKSFTLVSRCHQLLSGILAEGHLPRVSRQSANDKDDNEMITGSVISWHLPYI